MSLFLTSALVIGAVHVAFVVATFVPSVSESQFARVAMTLEMPVRADLADDLVRRNAVRLRTVAVGGLVGFVLAVIPLAFATGLSYERSTLAALAATVLGWTVALCVTSLRTLEPPRGIRVARATSVGLDDYLSPVSRLLVGIAVAVALVGVAVVSLVSGTSALASIAAAIALVTFVTAEIASRRIIAQRQPADSDLELAWNDAMRAQVVRDLYAAPAGFAGAAIVLAALSVAGSSIEGHALNVISLLLLVASLFARSIATHFRVRQHVLRRLWPAQLRTGWYR